jgi:bacillithiol system protein YtxJ
MAKINTLDQVEDWQKLWNGLKPEYSGALLIFKQSPICPTSHYIEEIFKAFVAELPESDKLRVYSVDVIGARPVSQQIAADTKIKHESPQALLIEGGQKVAWHASHGDIDDDSLARNVVIS